jgi:putative ABC transport system permease protein
MSLALATLLYEWRRYMAAVIALAFSGLLILAQVGLFSGMVQSATATIERSRAQIMVLPPKVESLMQGGGGGLPKRVEPLLYMNPEVVEVASFGFGGGGMWANFPKAGAKQVNDFVRVMAVDTRADAVTLPIDYPEATRVALQEPFVVAIDRTALRRLGVGLGDKAVLNGKTVKVGVILDGYPELQAATVVMSRDTLRALGMGPRGGRSGMLAVRIKDPARAEIVRDQLNAIPNRGYRAWTRAELAEANQKGLMQEQIIGIFLGFSVFLGFLIGVGITSQTLRGAILANIKELASLRALGVSMGSLRRIVLELSLWVGVVGLAATTLFVAGVAALAKSVGVPMSFPMGAVIGVSILLLAISLASGLMSMGVLKKSQPADLLR